MICNRITSESGNHVSELDK